MELTEDQIKRIEDLMPNIRSGVAKDHESKIAMVVLSNEIFGTNYRPTTNCGTCLNDAYQKIKRIAKQYRIK